MRMATVESFPAEQVGGQIRIDYTGQLPEELKTHLFEVEGLRVAGLRPLTLRSGRPEELLNRIYRYLADERMRVTRVQLRCRSV